MITLTDDEGIMLKTLLMSIRSVKTRDLDKMIAILAAREKQLDR
jgi:hypothetical protein